MNRSGSKDPGTHNDKIIRGSSRGDGPVFIAHEGKRQVLDRGQCPKFSDYSPRRPNLEKRLFGVQESFHIPDEIVKIDAYIRDHELDYLEVIPSSPKTIPKEPKRLDEPIESPVPHEPIEYSPFIQSEPSKPKPAEVIPDLEESTKVETKVGGKKKFRLGKVLLTGVLGFGTLVGLALTTFSGYEAYLNRGLRQELVQKYSADDPSQLEVRLKERVLNKFDDYNVSMDHLNGLHLFATNSVNHKSKLSFFDFKALSPLYLPTGKSDEGNIRFGPLFLSSEDDSVNSLYLHEVGHYVEDSRRLLLNPLIKNKLGEFIFTGESMSTSYKDITDRRYIYVASFLGTPFGVFRGVPMDRSRFNELFADLYAKFYLDSRAVHKNNLPMVGSVFYEGWRAKRDFLEFLHFPSVFDESSCTKERVEKDVLSFSVELNDGFFNSLGNNSRCLFGLVKSYLYDIFSGKDK